MNAHLKSLLFSMFLTMTLMMAACAPQQFTGTNFVSSGTNNDLSNDDQVPTPTPRPNPSPSPSPSSSPTPTPGPGATPTPVPTPSPTPAPTATPGGPTIPAQTYSLTNLCVLTSPDFATGWANYLSVANQKECEDYGLDFYNRKVIYEIEVRYLPRVQVETIVKAITGESTITSSTRISLSAFLAAIRAGTTPIAVYNPYN